MHRLLVDPAQAVACSRAVAVALGVSEVLGKTSEDVPPRGVVVGVPGSDHTPHLAGNVLPMKPSDWSLLTTLFLAAVTVYLAFRFTPEWWSVVTFTFMAVATVLSFSRWILERRAERRAPNTESPAGSAVFDDS